MRKMTISTLNQYCVILLAIANIFLPTLCYSTEDYEPKATYYGSPYAKAFRGKLYEKYQWPYVLYIFFIN